MRIQILLPMSRPMPIFVDRLFGLTERLKNKGIDYSVERTMYSPIEVARNVLAGRVDQRTDYALFLDDDMAFPSDIAERLVKHNVDIVGALMFTKFPPFTPALKRIVDSADPNGYQNFTDYPKDTLFEVAAIGFAATLIHRRVFEELGEQGQNGKEWFTFTNGRGEDIDFCIRARQKGFRVWCDSTIKTRHVGGYGVGEENWLAWKDNKIPMEDRV